MTTNGVIAGRELIHTGTFTDQMWCNGCDIPLSLKYAVGKMQKGISNVYEVKCYKCEKVKNVYTDKRFDAKNNGGYLFASNVKLAMGKIIST